MTILKKLIGKIHKSIEAWTRNSVGYINSHDATGANPPKQREPLNHSGQGGPDRHLSGFIVGNGDGGGRGGCIGPTTDSDSGGSGDC